MTIEEIETVLQVYSLEEILELNDCTPEDCLYFLVEQEFVTLPNPEPI